ncbi:SulP family inorganic anion transporter [Microvirga massiliensis]|uniref:SulP family inorganic anion transporter n=1 Tax=Microvirga massiliensis TaxID=1033741 RepID=UPI000ADFB92B|nr:SulP family inorganic anion transporter [Microvirga massiliensis]
MSETATSPVIGGQSAGGAARSFLILASLRGFRISWLPRDMVAGVMLAAIAIPEQLATARLAGMAPETGLYAFAAGSLAFAVFGANRYMSVGGDSTIAPIFAGGLAALTTAATPHYAELAGTLALLVGIILVASGLLRAGWLAGLLSIPVTTGFLAGISVHIIVGQLPAILGIPDTDGPVLARLVHVLARLDDANLYAVVIGLAVFAVSLGAERISARIPGALIGLVAAGLAVAAFHLDDRGVTVLGTISANLPTLAFPSSGRVHDLAHLVPLALVIAMVCIMQTAAVVRAFPSETGTSENVSRDFAGVGAGCVLAGLIGAFTVNASPPRTAVVAESGGRSQIASVFGVAVIAAVLLLAAGALAYVPHAALAGVLASIGLRIVRVRDIVRIFRHGGYEFLLLVASAMLVVLLPIETGMLLAVVLSLLHSLYIFSRPPSGPLLRVPGTTLWCPPSPDRAGEHVAGVLVFAPGAPLNFVSADYIRNELRQALAIAPEPVELLVIDASAVFDIDYTGSQDLQRTIAGLHEQHTDVAIAHLSVESVRREAERTGLLDAIGPNRVFTSVEQAIQALGPGRPSFSPRPSTPH